MVSWCEWHVHEGQVVGEEEVVVVVEEVVVVAVVVEEGDANGVVVLADLQV